jgi:hypothetical protein
MSLTLFSARFLELLRLLWPIRLYVRESSNLLLTGDTSLDRTFILCVYQYANILLLPRGKRRSDSGFEKIAQLNRAKRNSTGILKRSWRAA